jgi:TetR/AcrR family transcriptional regulator, transcriptional repressor for nem operon
MSDVKIAIMDAAERRMQLGGFGGFSFRELATDVGIKSSSVHYHFPTKEALAAAVIRRWAEETSKFIDEELAKDPDPVRVERRSPRGTCALARSWVRHRRICRLRSHARSRGSSRCASTS